MSAAALVVVAGCSGESVVDADGSSESSGDPTMATEGEGHTTVSVPDACEVVLVPDPALANALRLELELPEGAEIPGALLASKDILFLVGAGITDLTGIECAVGVEQFFASDNQIVDTTVLANLPRLSNVSLDNNAITDLSPWSGHPLLFTLGVSNNQITSTAPLHDLPTLANLDVSNNPITAMEGLDGVPSLFSLRLQNTQVHDLSFLAKLPSLDNVYADGAEIVDLATLPDMPTLTFLSLIDNAIADATTDASLPSLGFLDLSGNEVVDVTGLAGAELPALASLVLDRNPLAGLDSVAALGPLTGLSINDTGVSDLSPLAAMDPPLQSLGARNNGIVDLTPVAAAHSLDLGGNAIVDLAALTGQSGTRVLELSDNAIADASPLLHVEFEDCATVTLAGNPTDAADVIASLCAADIVVTGECLPDACNPCPPDAKDCG